MKRPRSILAITTLLVFVSCVNAFAQDSFLSSIPSWAKIIVRVNAREDSESISTLTKMSKTRTVDTEALQQLLLGVAQAGLMQINRDLDIERDVLSWVGRQGAIAIDPGMDGKSESFLFMLEVRDHDRAAGFFQRALPAIASSVGGSLKSAEVGGGMTWTLSVGGDHVALGLSSHALGVSNKLESLQAWLGGESGSQAISERANAALAKVPAGLVSFYVDQSFFESKEVLGGNPALQMLKLKAVVGSVTYQEDGVHYEVANLVGEGSLLLKAATSIPPGPSRAFMTLPNDTLLAIALTSPSALLSAAPLPVDAASMITLMAGPLANDIPAAAINALLGSEVAVALTRLDESPSVAIALAGTDHEGMSQALKALRGLADKTGVVKLTEANVDGMTVLKITGLLPPGAAGSDVPPIAAKMMTALMSEIHVAEAGGRIVFASNMDTLKRALSQQGDSDTLAVNPQFRKARSRMPEKSIVMVYADPSAILQKSTSLLANIGNVRNKYLDRAFELIGGAFPFFALAVGVDNDGMRTVAHIGLDYTKIQNASAAPVLVAMAIGASSLYWTRASAVAAPSQVAAVEEGGAAPAPPSKPAAPKKATPAKKKTTKARARKK